MSNHFNPSLSQSSVQKWTRTAIIKCKLKLRVTFYMTNGGEHRSNWQGKAIIIRLNEVIKVYNHAYQKYEQTPTKLNLRNFSIIRLGRKCGLRNSEIRTLLIEGIDFETRIFQVLDSKKHVYFPLTADVLTLHFIKELIEGIQRGYVFPHMNGWKIRKKGEPLSYVEIWQITHNIAVKAGVKGYSPRMGRHYFAAHSIFDLKMNVVVLQRILRHKNLAVTTVYLSKLVFFEDIQKEFEGIRNSPIVPETADVLKTEASLRGCSFPRQSLSVAGETICNDCSNVEFCKYAPLPSWRKTCVFKPEKKEELKI
jgi:integrase